MILLVGPPGAGKSLQAKLIEKELGFKWIAMGALLRKQLEGAARDKMKSGEMIEDTITFSVLEKEIINTSKTQPIILDGFPRRDSQVDWFLDFIEKDHRDLKLIIHLKVSEKVSVERLKKRDRMDDDKRIVKNRYHLYQSEILPMVEHLKNKGYKVAEIDGEKSIDQVSKEMIEVIREN